MESDELYNLFLVTSADSDSEAAAQNPDEALWEENTSTTDIDEYKAIGFMCDPLSQTPRGAKCTSSGARSSAEGEGDCTGVKQEGDVTYWVKSTRNNINSDHGNNSSNNSIVTIEGAANGSLKSEGHLADWLKSEKYNSSSGDLCINNHSDSNNNSNNNSNSRDMVTLVAVGGGGSFKHEGDVADWIKSENKNNISDHNNNKINNKNNNFMSGVLTLENINSSYNDSESNNSGNSSSNHTDTEILCALCNKVCGDHKALEEHLQSHLQFTEPRYLQAKKQEGIPQGDVMKVIPIEKNDDGQDDVMNVIESADLRHGGAPLKDDSQRHEIRQRHEITQRHENAQHQKPTVHVYGKNILNKHRPPVKPPVRVNHTKGGEPRGHKCEICGKSFSQKDSLGRHSLIHASEEDWYECETCGKRFSHKVSRDRHMKLHTGEKPFNCTMCGEKFRESHSLRLHHSRHNDSIHRNGGRGGPRCSSVNTGDVFKCAECGKEFLLKNSLKEHMRTHNKDMQYKCDECDKSFAHLTNLKRHKKSIHSEVRDFKCEVCDKGYIEKRYLDRHLKSNEHAAFLERKKFKGFDPKSDDISPETMATFLDPKNNKKCTKCGIQFPCNAILLTHIDGHLGIKRFKCELCDTRFKRSDTLARHINIMHVNGKKFKCDKCGRAFGTVDGLKAHMEVHSEKRYNCPKCKSSFKHKKNLASHLKMDHK